ncbi:hypothetical protein ACN47E_003436 [Coniothyrium glycines]
MEPRAMYSTVDHPHASITTRNATASPLLRLPRELRDLVYHHAFKAKSLSTRRNGSTPGPETIHLQVRNFSDNNVPLPSLLQLTSTCRQIAAETHNLVFAVNTLHVPHVLLLDLVAKLPARIRSAIPRLEICPNWPTRIRKCGVWSTLALRLVGMQHFPMLREVVLLIAWPYRVPWEDFVGVRDMYRRYTQRELVVTMGKKPL